MHRTQLLLDEWQYEVLKACSERERRSISAIVRAILDDQLSAAPVRSRDPLEQIEGIADEPGRYGRDHDDVLYGKK